MPIMCDKFSFSAISHSSPRSTPISIPGSILLKPAYMMHSSSRAEKVLPGSDRRTWVSLGVIDVQAILPLQADLESNLPDLIQCFSSEQPHGIQQIEDRIHPRPTSLQLPSSNLPQALPG